MELFEKPRELARRRMQPLAARMRPRSLEELVGQDNIVGPGKLLRRAIEADRLNSIILFGPPGCGKTSLAEVIATVTRRYFERASGAISNVADLRALIHGARSRADFEADRGDGSTPPRGTILFIDEIHRFNKAQQDVLLPFVEDGTVTLIGATTHNPMFFINTPLTSRSLVFELAPLTEASAVALLQRALIDPRGFPGQTVRADEDALEHIARLSEGDARRSLNALEVAVLTTPPSIDGSIHITRTVAEDSVQKKAVIYDHDEDGHYDTISAFIKSVRGSDPHAAIYWLAKMLYAGEDPRFVARRLVILASEDIGNADPRGLSLAVSAMHAAEFVGMPEARIILAQATTYLATAPKSNASYAAIDKAYADVEKGRVLDVPRHLKNKKLRTADRPENSPEDTYRYPHDFNHAFVEQDYIPTTTRYYEPAGNGYEEIIASRMSRLQTRMDENATRRENENGKVL